MSALTTLRARERVALLETLRGVGPDAPTLCGRWSAADIAGHLVVSEASFGLPMVVVNAARRVLPAAVTRRGIEALQSTGDRLIERRRKRGWDNLLRRLEAGPPVLYRFGHLAHVRLVEEWVHHEDVRRASGVTPRPLDAETDEALWQAALTLATYREFRPGREQLEVAVPDGRTARLGEQPTIRVQGRPGELLLYLAGRTEHADVDVTGDPKEVRDMQSHLSV